MLPVMVKFILILLVMLVSACTTQEVRSAADIQTAVEEYLAQRGDLFLGYLSIKVDKVSYMDTHAIASVSISAGDDPEATMRMVYELEQNSGKWEVMPTQGIQESGDDMNTGQTAAPGLPLGHPPTGGSSSELPPGHPPLSEQPDP